MITIEFADDYTPVSSSVSTAIASLRNSEAVAVRWPDRTVDLLERKRRSRATILEDLIARGGGPDGVPMFHQFLAEVERFYGAGVRLPALLRALRGVGADDPAVHAGVDIFLRLANLHLLRAIARIELAGEDLGLGPDFRTLNDVAFLNTCSGHDALGTSDTIYSVDVEFPGQEPSVYASAPQPLVESLAYGDAVTGELLSRWSIPAWEIHLLHVNRTVERDYLATDYRATHRRNQAEHEI